MYISYSLLPLYVMFWFVPLLCRHLLFQSVPLMRTTPFTVVLLTHYVAGMTPPIIWSSLSNCIPYASYPFPSSEFQSTASISINASASNWCFFSISYHRLLFFFSSLLLLIYVSAWVLHIRHCFLIDTFITYSGFMTLKWEWCYVPYFVSVLHAYLLVSFLLCVLLAHFSAVYQTTSDLPAILILSSYVPLCHITDTFLFCTDFLTCTFHSILSLTYDSLPCTTYASLSPSSTSLILRILMCYLTVHLRVHSQIPTCPYYLWHVSFILLV